MTKLKSKKMTKSTFAVIIMAILMVAMLAFGGTYAYFTATTNADKATLTLGYVKLSDDNALTKITLQNVLPGDTIVTAGAITLDVDTTDIKGNYVAVRFDYQITLDDAVAGDPGTPATVLNATTIAAHRTAAATDPKSAAYVKIFDSLTADNILNTEALTVAESGNVAGLSYYWKNFGTDKNIYFVVDASTAADHSGLYAVGAAKADAGVTTSTAYTAAVTLTVNKDAFVLDKAIADNWTEDETQSDYGIMKAKIEIAMTAASIQVSNITTTEAVAELVAKLPAVSFTAGA